MSAAEDPALTAANTAGDVFEAFAKSGQLPIPGMGPSRLAGTKGLLGRFFNSTVANAAAFAAGMATRDPMRPVLQDLTNESWKLHQSKPLTGQEAAAAVQRAAMKYDEAAAEASLTGINGDRFSVLNKLAGLAPSPEQLVTMFRRKVITQDRLREGLVQGNVRTEWADALIGITRNLPSVSALVRFAVREAFGGGSELSGTTAELPEELVRRLEEQGVAPEDAAHYWAAHWQLPSPTQAYQMLHRGVIDQGTLLSLLRVADYPPFWRGKLQEIAYHVPTRVDLRRMLEHDVIDEARVLRGYKDIGYNDADAATMTKFAVELAKPKTTANAHHTNWADRALGMAFGDVHLWVKKGDMTEAQASAALTAIGIPPAAAAAAAGYWASVVAAHG